MIVSRFRKNYPSLAPPGAGNIALLALAVLYAVMWAGGISSYFFGNGPPPGAEWTAPAFLFLAGLMVVVSEGRRAIPLTLAVAGMGFAAEVIGSRYGVIFGEYLYTETLAPSLLGVPVAMAAAWLILFAYVKQMLAAFGLAGWAQVLLSALWMTAIDLVIDPLAAGPLNYWRWKESGAYYGIPAHNFIGWLAVSLLIFLLVRAVWGPGWQPNRWARFVGFSIVLFFTLIALSARFFMAACIGGALCAIHAAVSACLFKAGTGDDRA
ncbi:MAG TPA: carotenoid biosynthesis protein [Blastocatellia bacterium]|jgi:putative membrane protein|nr:carotenoid biosynthesis protein [Blastocatellia bacterium]